IIDADLKTGVHQRVATRFPPEPNGYLHIGHAKSICLNFSLAADYHGTCNLRYDDTNPTKEDVEYVESIEADVRWLGFTPSAVLFSADYFERMYAWAEALVSAGKAYVCDLNDEEIRLYRGSLSEPGKPSPWRDRSVADNLDLLRRMKAGEFPDGARTLRAKIDMASANMKMRDPLLYRIRHAHHHRSGDQWCIYPMYDFAHPLEDAIEGITHSICTLEFENNRDLYDWVMTNTNAAQASGHARAPKQYEFARLALDYTVMSKRKLLQLVVGKHVDGWDDPRMPTIAGMRRRGYSAAAIRAFCDLIGVAKANSTVDIGKLEYCVRDDLNGTAPRVLAVTAPLPFEITNWNELATVEQLTPGTSVALDAPYWPADVGKPGSRAVAFGPTLLIDQTDFQVTPSPDFLRLAPGRTIRLRYAYCITCDEVVTRADGSIAQLRGRVHPESKAGGKVSTGEKVWGVIHWVDAATSVPAELRLYDRLFSVAKPEEGGSDFIANMNPHSLTIVPTARVEASLGHAPPGSRWQFERTGYFIVDSSDSTAAALVFNRIIDLGQRASTTSTKIDAATTAHSAAAVVTSPTKNAKAATRPKSKSPQEFRDEARKRDAALHAEYERIAALLGGNTHDADLLAGDTATAGFFAACTTAGASPLTIAKWMINELPRVLDERELTATSIDAARFAALVQAIDNNELSASAGKQVLAELALPQHAHRSVAQLAARFTNRHDAGALDAAIASVLAVNADKVAQYQAGKTGLLGFFVGNVMKAQPGLDAGAVNKAVAAALTSGTK
nr:glutamine--tRNA ligase/YqeY domain fusion protein [Kofleriaceae bacterium]